MKKAFFKECLLFGIVLLLAGTVFTFYLPAVQEVGNTRNWKTYDTIQDAINDAIAGDTLWVANDTYEENVIVNKAVTIRPYVGNTATVDGDDGVTFTITEDGAGATIRSLIITNDGSDAGIKIESDDNIIYDNTIEDCYRGIYLYGSYANNVTGNVITCNDISNYENEGILFYYASENWAYSNTLTGDDDENDEELAILFMNASYNAVYANTMEDNNFGIYIWGSSNYNKIHHNNFIDNSPYSAYVDTVLGSTVNYWDNSGVGNYWSDFSDIDSDSDGIYDNPYPIPDGVGGVSDEDEQDDEDGYPLVSAWYPTVGNVNGDPDGDITASDISWLSYYLYSSGPEPVPPCAGDVNGDGQVTGADYSYLVAYLYMSGPAPVGNCCSKLVLPY